MIQQTSEREDEVADLSAIMLLLWRRRIWIISSVILCAVALGVVSFLMTRTYRAEVLLIPASAERSSMSNALSSALGQLGGLASLAGLNASGSGSDTQEALAVLRSRQFTVDFVNDLRLMPDIFADKWDASAGKWRSAQPTAAKAYRVFDKQIRSVIQDKKTGLITVQIDWSNREKAAIWANELVAKLNSEMRGRAIEKSEANLAYLEKELGGTSVMATREAIGHLIEAQINQRMVASVNQEFAFRVVDKASIPDANDPVSPRRVLMTLGGAILGGIVGTIIVLSIGSR